MVQFLWRNDSTLYQPFHTQAGFRVLAIVSHMDGGVSDGNLEILAYVWVETHDIHILDSLFFTHFVVQTHRLSPAPHTGQISGNQNEFLTTEILHIPFADSTMPTRVVLHFRKDYH